MGTLSRLTAAGLLLTILWPSPLFGYIDPGTGSFVLQVLAAALLGSLFAIKSWWKKALKLLRGLPRLGAPGVEDGGDPAGG